MKKRYLLFLILFFLGIKTKAQDCQSKLFETYKLYEAGRFEEAIHNLDTCLKNDFDKTQQARAWKLIAFCYTSLGDTIKARDAVERFMLLNPTYRVNKKSDLAQFQYMVEQCRPKPKMSLGLVYSRVYSRAFLTQPYSLDGTSKKYTLGRSNAIAGQLLYNGKRRLMLSLNAGFLSQQFGFSQNTNGFDITHDETSNSLQAGAMAGYQFMQKKKYRHIAAYTFGGLHYTGLLSAQADLSRTYTLNGSVINDNNTNVLSRRRKNQWGWDAGIGYTNSLFFAELQFSGNLLNNVLAERRYADSRSVYDYYFVYDNFWLGNIQLKLGITFANLSYRKR